MSGVDPRPLHSVEQCSLWQPVVCVNHRLAVGVAPCGTVAHLCNGPYRGCNPFCAPRGGPTPLRAALAGIPARTVLGYMRSYRTRASVPPEEQILLKKIPMIMFAGGRPGNIWPIVPVSQVAKWGDGTSCAPVAR